MKRKPNFAPYIGPLWPMPAHQTPSCAPMRSEDLIEAFARELKYLLRTCRVDRETRKAHVAYIKAAGSAKRFDTEPQILELLVSALSHYAPPYTYFGERDGDYGFWPQEADVPHLTAHANMPEDYRAYWGADVLLANENGNVECGRFDKRGRFHSYWSAV